MAQARGRETAALSDRLLARPWEFDFFQAVRVLEWMAHEAAAGDLRPGEELVRFRVPATSAFAAGSISGLRRAGKRDDGSAKPAELQVSFLGLIGQSGVLPQHYTAEVIERSHQNDHALRDFMDIFHHRAVAMFFAAWRKYRLPFVIEKSRRAGQEEVDTFTIALRSLVGLGTHGVEHRLSVPDEAILFYSGHYGHAPRNAVSLERLLNDFFRLPAEVVQFVGQWLTLPPEERTKTPGKQRLGMHCSLNRDAIVGSRVWDVQSRFRVRIGPMKYSQFLEFFPGGPAMRRLADLVRLYVGPALAFDVQPILQKDEVPTAQLSAPAPAGRTHLGWNSWLKKKSRGADAEDAKFVPARR
jgi:type VI secretion system protein ImpH